MQRSGASLVWDLENLAKEVCKNNSQQKRSGHQDDPGVVHGETWGEIQLQQRDRRGQQIWYNESRGSGTMVMFGMEFSKCATTCRVKCRAYALRVIFADWPGIWIIVNMRLPTTWTSATLLRHCLQDVIDMMLAEDVQHFRNGWIIDDNMIGVDRGVP